MDPGQADLGFRSHMSLLQLDGAGTWLHAIPSEALGTKVAPQPYIPMLQRRLRMQLFDEPFFGHVAMRSWTSGRTMHSLAPAGGGRTK